MPAALKRTSPVTFEIGQIRGLVAENTNEHGFYLTVDRSRILRDRLEVISRAVANMERELAVHRIAEQDAAAAGVLDDFICELLEEAVGEDEIDTCNIVFPSFEKGRQS
ncbi:hypothetical protein SAMN04515647_1592 [Cohaesibacter sp. ES.047]|uniref:hypothetical protein n=1 Tax=Cohaesibacter sp. ES.047 TaxID=1798205 RepID=UPI000BB8C1E1|nr:hypothetical protein [Cohaesibacter sp. ES.047]SNY91370.1 hypothetical protein SAMN04515647_1592 [Cohaesibacter sp. ES.047]